MRFVVAMTANAFRRRVAMFLVAGMTVGALGFEMCAEQFEVGEIVIKDILIENYHFRIAAFVLNVTRRTLLGARLGMQAVIAGSCVNIRSNVLVTVHAQSALGRFPEHRVAGGALRLNLGMAGNDRPGHYQRLDVLRRSLFKGENGDRH